MTRTEDFIAEVKVLLENVTEEFDVKKLEIGKYFKTLWLEDHFLAFPKILIRSYQNAFLLLKGGAEATGRLVSDKELDKLLVKFLFKLHFDYGKSALENLPKETSQLFKAVKHLQREKYIVILPLVNVQTDISLQIGNSNITNLSEARIEEIATKYNLSMMEGRTAAKIVKDIKGESKFPTVVIVEVEASDPDKAEELAIQTADRSLNVLRFYEMSFRGLIKGEAFEIVKRATVIVGTTNDKFQFGSHLLHSMPGVNRITKNLITKLKMQQFDTLNGLLTKPENQITPLERDLLAAIYWIGSSVKDILMIDKFLKYIVSLDTLPGQDRKDKTEIIARRFVSIMYHEDKDEKILQAYHLMKRFYGIRNNIMHTGLSHIEQTNFEQLAFWTHNLVYRLLRYQQKYKRLSDLIELKFPIKDDLINKIT